MEAYDIKKMKDLEDENRRIKQMFADLSHECHALKDVIEKSFKTSDKTGTRQLSEGTICHEYPPGVQNGIVEQDSVFYQPDTRRDETVIMALTELAERYPRIEIGLNISAQRVDRIVANRGYPLKMRLNNGSVLVSLTIAQCAEEHGVALEFIKPGEQHRMRLSNGLTGRTGQKSWIFTCSRH